MYGVKSVCDQMAHGRMDHVLLNLVASWKALALPVRTIQLDDWWYLGTCDGSTWSDASHDLMCVKELAPKPDLFPTGLPPLPAEISWNLYGPFFCEDNVYQAKIPFVNSSKWADGKGGDGSKDSDPTPNASEALYSEIFKAQRAAGVPLSNYEVDFLQDQTTWFAPYVQKVDGSAKWLSGMARAAEQLNMSVQYCMAHPASFLHALALPAVSNGRASGDYQSPVENLLQVGSSAPFFAAVGIAPSKDNFWSTPDQPRPGRS
eukprot:SAG22_NODE_5001_length_1111_cov_1.159091_1_plen_260_part_01